MPDRDPVALPELALDPPEQRLADELSGTRPAPAPRFRGALGRALAEADPGYGPRPARLVPMVGGLVGGGAVLIGLGALHAAGVF